MKRSMTVSILSACMAIGFLFVTAGSADAGSKGKKFRDFAGTWTCSAKHDNPPILAQIFEFNLRNRGGVTGDLTQAQAGLGVFECDIDGSATRHPAHRARINMELNLSCDIPGFGSVNTTETAECIGSGRTRRGGYNKLVCLDQTPLANEADIITLAHCDRQDISRHDDD